MGHRRKDSADYQVAVAAAARDFEWRVTGARGVVMAGAAPTLHSADRSGAFAAEALRALDRIGRRRF